jgi:hypothetical protein
MATQQTTREQTDARGCVHHWMVEPAGGPTSGARCRLCGEERAFYNNPDAVTDAEMRSKSGFGQRTNGHHRSQSSSNARPARG